MVKIIPFTRNSNGSELSHYSKFVRVKHLLSLIFMISDDVLMDLIKREDEKNFMKCYSRVKVSIGEHFSLLSEETLNNSLSLEKYTKSNLHFENDYEHMKNSKYATSQESENFDEEKYKKELNEQLDSDKDSFNFALSFGIYASLVYYSTGSRDVFFKTMEKLYDGSEAFSKFFNSSQKYEGIDIPNGNLREQIKLTQISIHLTRIIFDIDRGINKNSDEDHISAKKEINDYVYKIVSGNKEKEGISLSMEQKKEIDKDYLEVPKKRTMTKPKVRLSNGTEFDDVFSCMYVMVRYCCEIVSDYLLCREKQCSLFESKCIKFFNSKSHISVLEKFLDQEVNLKNAPQLTTDEEFKKALQEKGKLKSFLNSEQNNRVVVTIYMRIVIGSIMGMNEIGEESLNIEEPKPEQDAPKPEQDASKPEQDDLSKTDEEKKQQSDVKSKISNLVNDSINTALNTEETIKQKQEKTKEKVISKEQKDKNEEEDKKNDSEWNLLKTISTNNSIKVDSTKFLCLAIFDHYKKIDEKTPYLYFFPFREQNVKDGYDPCNLNGLPDDLGDSIKFLHREQKICTTIYLPLQKISDLETVSEETKKENLEGVLNEIINRPSGNIQYITKNRDIMNHIANNFYSMAYQIAQDNLKLNRETQLNLKLASQLTIDILIDFGFQFCMNKNDVKQRFQAVIRECSSKDSINSSSFFPIFNSILFGEYIHLNKKDSSKYRKNQTYMYPLQDFEQIEEDSAKLTFCAMEHSLSIFINMKDQVFEYLKIKMKNMSSSIKTKNDETVIKKVYLLYCITLKFFIANKDFVTRESDSPSDIMYYITEALLNSDYGDAYNLGNSGDDDDEDSRKNKTGITSLSIYSKIVYHTICFMNMFVFSTLKRLKPKLVAQILETMIGKIIQNNMNNHDEKMYSIIHTIKLHMNSIPKDSWENMREKNNNLRERIALVNRRTELTNFLTMLSDLRFNGLFNTTHYSNSFTYDLSYHRSSDPGIWSDEYIQNDFKNVWVKVSKASHFPETIFKFLWNPNIQILKKYPITKYFNGIEKEYNSGITYFKSTKIVSKGQEILIPHNGVFSYQFLYNREMIDEYLTLVVKLIDKIFGNSENLSSFIKNIERVSHKKNLHKMIWVDIKNNKSGSIQKINEVLSIDFISGLFTGENNKNLIATKLEQALNKIDQLNKNEIKKIIEIYFDYSDKDISKEREFKDFIEEFRKSMMAYVSCESFNSYLTKLFLVHFENFCKGAYAAKFEEHENMIERSQEVNRWINQMKVMNKNKFYSGFKTISKGCQPVYLNHDTIAIQLNSNKLYQVQNKTGNKTDQDKRLNMAYKFTCLDQTPIFKNTTLEILYPQMFTSDSDLFIYEDNIPSMIDCNLYSLFFRHPSKIISKVVGSKMNELTKETFNAAFVKFKYKNNSQKITDDAYYSVKEIMQIEEINQILKNSSRDSVSILAISEILKSHYSSNQDVKKSIDLFVDCCCVSICDIRDFVKTIGESKISKMYKMMQNENPLQLCGMFNGYCLKLLIQAVEYFHDFGHAAFDYSDINIIFQRTMIYEGDDDKKDIAASCDAFLIKKLLMDIFFVSPLNAILYMSFCAMFIYKQGYVDIDTLSFYEEYVGKIQMKCHDAYLTYEDVLNNKKTITKQKGLIDPKEDLTSKIKALYECKDANGGSRSEHLDKLDKLMIAKMKQNQPIKENIIENMIANSLLSRSKIKMGSNSKDIHQDNEGAIDAQTETEGDDEDDKEHDNFDDVLSLNSIVSERKLVQVKDTNIPTVYSGNSEQKLYSIDLKSKYKPRIE